MNYGEAGVLCASVRRAGEGSALPGSLHLSDHLTHAHAPLRQDRTAVRAADHRPQDRGAPADRQLHHGCPQKRLSEHDEPGASHAVTQHHQPDCSPRLCGFKIPQSVAHGWKPADCHQQRPAEGFDQPETPYTGQ